MVFQLARTFYPEVTLCVLWPVAPWSSVPGAALSQQPTRGAGQVLPPPPTQVGQPDLHSHQPPQAGLSPGRPQYSLMSSFASCPTPHPCIWVPPRSMIFTAVLISGSASGDPKLRQVVKCLNIILELGFPGKMGPKQALISEELGRF